MDLWGKAVNRASQKWGRGFPLLGTDGQQGAIAYEVLVLLSAQAEEVSDVRVRELLEISLRQIQDWDNLA